MWDYIKPIFAVAVLIVALWLSASCAKNPDTGEYEPDYPTIASATNISAETLSFEGLKWLHQNKPEYVEDTYTDLVSVSVIIGNYADGDVVAGEVVLDAIEIFQRVQARFENLNEPVVNIIIGTVGAISGALNIVITAVPEDAALVLTNLALGLNSGLERYSAWAATQTPEVTGLMP